MAQNSNISISSVAARFINAPIDRKKRAVSSREPMTDRPDASGREQIQEASANCADRKFFWETALSLFPGSPPLTSTPERL